MHSVVPVKHFKPAIVKKIIPLMKVVMGNTVVVLCLRYLRRLHISRERPLVGIAHREFACDVWEVDCELATCFMKG
jgi:hypothetical protein